MNVALALGGGVALGAYDAGAYAALHEREELRPVRIAGTSIGAITGALIAGNPPGQRVARLREFWDQAAVDPPWPAAGVINRRALNQLSILGVRTFGRPGFFDPELPGALLRPGLSIYDPEPLRKRLARMIDFELLNQASFSVTTTDIETGEAVVFDTRRGHRITPEHLVASCGFLPEFPPLEIDGRLLGDGGLVANTPVAWAVDWDRPGAWTLFVVDPFCARRGRPSTLEQAATRRLDLLFANQTRQALRQLEARGGPRLTIVELAYRAPLHEGGPDKMFNFARSTLAERWAAGERDMRAAMERVEAVTP